MDSYFLTQTISFFSTFIKYLICLLNSNFSQNIILCGTLLVTLLIYRKNNKQRLKEAASTIYMQIEMIKKNAQDDKDVITDDGFDIEKAWTSVELYKDSSWELYRKILFSQLTHEEIECINLYYEYATIINEQILYLHRVIGNTYFEFYSERKMCHKLSNNEKPIIRTSKILTTNMKKNIETLIDTYNKLPINKLNNLTK